MLSIFVFQFSEGLENLTNVCKGQLYGPASNWSKREVRRLGSWLLWKSFMILLNEGERQIRYKDVNDAELSWTAPVGVNRLINDSN